MSLADLATLLQDTAASIHHAEQALTDHPMDFATRLNLQSLTKRQTDLQARFEEVAAASQVEILYYRLIPNVAEPPIKAINEVLATFQLAFSIVYDSISRHVKKTRASLSDSSARASTLGFAYSFEGSVGFALTLPREAVLLPTDHDATVKAIRDLTTVRNADDVQKFANDYGTAAVRSIYKWVDAIARNDLDSGVRWASPSAAPEPEFLLQVPDARAIREVLASTSVVEVEDKRYRGTLLGYDSQKRTFRYAIGDRKNVHGTVSKDITQTLRVPAKYDARVRVTTTSRYSTDQKEERFELLEITPSEALEK